jgi:hypothetical protein
MLELGILMGRADIEYRQSDECNGHKDLPPSSVQEEIMAKIQAVLGDRVQIVPVPGELEELFRGTPQDSNGSLPDDPDFPPPRTGMYL